ncbi:MAG TPA: hypothetical protein VF173_36180 [Thermoanaerobaculia bacterium]|nr:hypothetical protein [Thermoanaerobaculia bacterium]
MSSIEQLVQAAQKEVLDSYRKEFDQLVAGFRDLDGKAQGTATVAGAFLAAGLALLNRPHGLSGVWPKALLFLGVVGLIVAVVASVQALRVRKVRSCPTGEDVAVLLGALKSIPKHEELEERLTYFYGDEANLWRSCIVERRAANERKAIYISTAQLCLLLTALSVTALITYLILTG